mgnify:CR=1 FL=1
MSNGYGKKGQVSLNTDLFMLSLWEHLCRDFRTITSFDCFRQEEKMIKEGIAAFRAYDFKRGYLSSPTYFKCRYQLESLFKRYTFKDDPISEEERAQRTLKSSLIYNKHVPFRMHTLLGPKRFCREPGLFVERSSANIL